MKYLTLIIVLATMTSCVPFVKTVKHKNEKDNQKETISNKTDTFSGEIIKIRDDDIVKVSSDTSKIITLIEDCGMTPIQKLNHDKSKIVINCYNENYNSLYVIDLSSNKVHKVVQFNRKKHQYFFSAVWADNNILFFGYEDEVISGPKLISKHGEVFEYNSAKNSKRNIGCSVSKRVIANIDKNRIAVNTGRSFNYIYIVKKRNCATVQKIYAKNKTRIKFSSDGNYYTYFDHKGDLFINNLKNSKEILLAGWQLDPKHVRWSPDGDKLSFDKKVSPETDPTRQVAIYTPLTDETIRTERPTMNSANLIENAFWSPNGKLLIYQSTSTFSNGETSWELHLYSVPAGKVIKTFGVSTLRTGGIMLWGWIDNHHILLSDSYSGLAIYQINDQNEFQQVMTDKLPEPYSYYVYASFHEK